MSRRGGQERSVARITKWLKMNPDEYIDFVCATEERKIASGFEMRKSGFRETFFHLFCHSRRQRSFVEHIDDGDWNVLIMDSLRLDVIVDAVQSQSRCQDLLAQTLQFVNHKVDGVCNIGIDGTFVESRDDHLLQNHAWHHPKRCCCVSESKYGSIIESVAEQERFDSWVSVGHFREFLREKSAQRRSEDVDEIQLKVIE